MVACLNANHCFLPNENHVLTPCSLVMSIITSGDGCELTTLKNVILSVGGESVPECHWESKNAFLMKSTKMGEDQQTGRLLPVTS